MIIGERIRKLRESKKLSQGDIERRTGMLCCYTSRVEHGHTIPSVETLERYALALDVPLYRFFYEGKNPHMPDMTLKNAEPALAAKQDRELLPFIKFFRRMPPRKRELLLSVARAMAGKNQ